MYAHMHSPRPPCPPQCHYKKSFLLSNPPGCEHLQGVGAGALIQSGEHQCMLGCLGCFNLPCSSSSRGKGPPRGPQPISLLLFEGPLNPFIVVGARKCKSLLCVSARVCGVQHKEGQSCVGSPQGQFSHKLVHLFLSCKHHVHKHIFCHPPTLVWGPHGPNYGQTLTSAMCPGSSCSHTHTHMHARAHTHARTHTHTAFISPALSLQCVVSQYLGGK